MVTEIQCQFLEPVDLGSKQYSDFEYSKINCNATTTPDIFTLIENPETGAEFYVEKSLNYGEAIIIWFLTLFTFYLIFKATFNFFWKK